MPGESIWATAGLLRETLVKGPPRQMSHYGRNINELSLKIVTFVYYSQNEQLQSYFFQNFLFTGFWLVVDGGSIWTKAGAP